MKKNPFILIWRARHTLAAITYSEIKSRYAGSVLGFWWAILSPLLFLSTYSIVYLYVFKLKPDSMSQGEYILKIFSGLVPFLFISEALTLGTTSLSANKELLKNTVFPTDLLPLRSVLVSTPGFIISFVIIFIASIFLGTLSAKILLLPVVILLLIMFVTGFVWILAPLHLAFKDVQNFLSFFILILMISSPIAYSPDMVPSKIRAFLYLNPITSFILNCQSIVLADVAFDFEQLFISLALSFVVFFLGYSIFLKVKEIMVNYVL